MDNRQRMVINGIVDNLISNFGLTPPVDLAQFVKTLGGEICYSDHFDNLEGTLEKIEDGSFKITIQTNHSPERQRFTIAHELGHLFLHTEYPEKDWNNECIVFHRLGANETEYQANEFAACLLMPKSDFIRFIRDNSQDNKIDISIVANHFEVSESAVLNRGRWLGIFEW